MHEPLSFTADAAISELYQDHDLMEGRFEKLQDKMQKVDLMGLRRLPGIYRSDVSSGFYADIPYSMIGGEADGHEEATVVFPPFDQTPKSDYVNILMRYLHSVNGGAVVSLHDNRHMPPSIGMRFERDCNLDGQSSELSLYAAQYADAIGRLGIKQAHLVGLQGGASVAVEVATQLNHPYDTEGVDIDSMLLVEPLNVQDRSPGKVTKVLGPKKNYRKKRKMIEAQQMPGLYEALPEYTDPLHVRAVFGEMRRAQRAHRQACHDVDNGLLLQDLSRDTLLSGIDKLQDTYSVVLRGMNSRVSPRIYVSDDYKVAKRNTRLLEMPLVGSEVIYAVPKIALLSAFALHKSENGD